MGDQVILSYHDSLIRASDLELLDSPNWLNDNLIGFMLEYFDKSLYAAYEDQVGFVGPDTVQFLKLGLGDDLGPCIAPLQLDTKDYLFLPINDNSDTDATGGTHWSLLVFDRKQQEYLHFDSSTSNKKDAKKVASILTPHIKASVAKFTVAQAPQQTNSSDCGMYAVCFVEKLCEKYLKGQSIDLIKMVTPDFVKSNRQEWKELIISLGENKK